MTLMEGRGNECRKKDTIAKMRDGGMSYSSIAKALDMKKVTRILVSLMLVMLALVTLAEGVAVSIDYSLPLT